ncbi:MAG: methyltransferase domain-containing protein, partial [Planctomycetota bacterium]
GIPANSAESIGCPAVTGASIETALAFGCRDEARRWARWLASIQRPDGSIPDATRAASSFENTAQAGRGFLAILDDLPEVEEAARRACHYLRSWIDDEGRVRPPSDDHRPNPGDPVADELPYLVPLLKAGRRWSVADWTTAVDRVVECWAGDTKAFPWMESVGGIARHAEQYLEHGRSFAAEKMMEGISTVQRRDGAVPERLGAGPVLGTSLALAAILWYRLGGRVQGDRAMRYLERRQLQCGGFRGGWGWLVPGSLRRENPWTAKHYLDAALLQVRAAFDTDLPICPDPIPSADGRVRAVREWLESLSPDARVADVGCGMGRYLRHLVGWFPRAQWTGIDVSPAMLDWLPDGVTTCQGSLLRIPAVDGAFDGAFAVESLEHSLAPERAIGELCRVVRPGGWVLVIDKHRAKQPLSEHDPWERWFLPEELAGWLGRYCDDVSVAPASHSEGRGGHDLFLAAQGTRKMRACADDSP